MFRLEHPEFFWLLALSLLFIVLYRTGHILAQRDWAKWGHAASNHKVRSSLQKGQPWTWLGLIAVFLLPIAAVNPQWGFKSVTAESKTADLYLLMDISNSMLAEDVAPSRLERARRFALDFSSTFKSDKVGLIFFAGNAYLQSPLTTDWRAIQLYVHAAHPDQAGTQGTAIGSAIRLALKSKSGENQIGQGALIVLTDGEDHDSDAVSAIEEATRSGWITYVIGAGTEKGSMIPIYIDGRKDVKRDVAGQPVITSMNRRLMLELAEKGGGRYFDLVEGTAIIESLQKELASLERSHLEKRSFSEHKSYFQWFLLPVILLVFMMAVVRYKFDVI